MHYSVPLYGQQHQRSGWAASLRMILGCYGIDVETDEAIAEPTNHASALQVGLNPTDSRPLQHWGLRMNPPQIYDQQHIMALLQRRGPLWIAADVRSLGATRFFPHIRVIRGFREMKVDLELMINDPFPGPNGMQYDETYSSLLERNELLGRDSKLPPTPIYLGYMV